MNLVELPVVEPPGNPFGENPLGGNPPGGEAQPTFIVTVATEEHCQFAAAICAEMEASAKVRGTGIAKRKPEYVEQKMRDGKAVIALTNAVSKGEDSKGEDSKGEMRVAGFCYIETWSGKKFVANSGLIVAPEFRKYGLATRLKRRVFELSRELYPDAKIFGITTSHAVMKINTELGYVPVPFSELTDDDTFWNGCSSCPNYDILSRTQRKMCLCTGMLYDPDEPRKVDEEFLAQLKNHPPDDEPPRPPIDLEPYT